MKGLKCTTQNCEFNEGYHCTAGILNIDKAGNCKTKLKRENGVIEQEFVNMETAQEFDYADNEDLLIECYSTDCIHNKNRRCFAKHVKICDCLMRTKCKTREL